MIMSTQKIDFLRLNLRNLQGTYRFLKKNQPICISYAGKLDWTVRLDALTVRAVQAGIMHLLDLGDIRLKIISFKIYRKMAAQIFEMGTR